MSGKTTNFDFDGESDWIESFIPDFSSTQEANSGKRQAEEVFVEKSKKICQSTNTGPALITPVIKEFCEELKSEKNHFINKVVKRVFPGPAGLLPDRLEKNKSISELISEDHDETKDDIQLCSQQSVSKFEEGPWKKMVKDFSVSNGEQLFRKFNISWIKKNSILKKMAVSYRAPFLASVIHSIEVIKGKIPTVNVTLKDSSGVIGGTISHGLYEEYAAYFTVDSVLVLRQFVILSVGDSYCVAITPTNLLSIYSKVIPKKTRDNSLKDGSVERIVLHQISAEEIRNIYNKNLEENSKPHINLRKIYDNSEIYLKNSSNSVKRVPVDSSSNSINAQRFPVQSISYNDNSIQLNTKSELSQRVFAPAHNSKKFEFKKTGGFLEENRLEIGTSASDNVNALKANESDNTRINYNQLSVPSNEKNTEIWKSFFEEVDTDSLFDEF